MSEKYTLTMAQHGAAATSNGLRAMCRGCDAAVMQVSGTFEGTVTFEATVDGTNWFTIQGASLADAATLATTATAAGAFRFQVRGLYAIRARVSAYVSGAITVAIGVS